MKTGIEIQLLYATSGAIFSLTDYRRLFPMKKVSAAFVSLLFSSVVLAQSAGLPGEAPPPRARPYESIVAHFKTSHGETSLEALLRLGMENKVALGIVRTDN